MSKRFLFEIAHSSARRPAVAHDASVDPASARVASICLDRAWRNILGLADRAHYGFRLVVNTLLVGSSICLFSLVSSSTPLALIVVLALAQGFFNSLQFSSLNAMAHADIEPADSSMATSIASTLQQLSLWFGLAFGSIIAG